MIEISLMEVRYCAFPSVAVLNYFSSVPCSLSKLNLPPICRYVCQSMQCNGVVICIEFLVEIKCVQKVEAC